MLVAAGAIALWSMSAPADPPSASPAVPFARAAESPLPAAVPDRAAVQARAPARGPVAALPSTDLPPLPMVQFPAPRPPEVIRAVYAFAANHPEVLSYIPCYCGCENFGHGDNHDCFVASRDAEGRVTWDAHGVG